MRCSGRRLGDSSSSGSLHSVVSSSNVSPADADINASVNFDAVDAEEESAVFDAVYTLGNVIGSGSYARVYRCVHRLTNENFAVKVIEDKMLSGYQRQLIRNEEAILRTMDHRNIIKLVAVFVNEQDVKRMVFEFADQLDVCLALATDPNFSELSIKGVAQQLFNGLSYIHAGGLVHRDLKLENLLVKSDAESNINVVKICDFGYAVQLPAGSTSLKLKNTIIGSFEYMSPELINSQEYSAKIDCWAAGVIVYFLFTGQFPFKGGTVTELVRRIMKREFTLDFDAPEWGAASVNAVRFIKGILLPLQCNRPTAKQLLQHEWFVDSPNCRRNATTNMPLPIMLQAERWEFLQQEAEMQLKRLYNNSSSNKPALILSAISCWSPGVAMRRYRNRFCGSHEATSAREFLVNGEMMIAKMSRRSSATR